MPMASSTTYPLTLALSPRGRGNRTKDSREEACDAHGGHGFSLLS